MNVVLTREDGKNDELRTWFGDGVNVIDVPLTATRYVAPDDVARELEDSAHFGSYGALVVTSARTANYVVLAMKALTTGAPVFSVGPATTRSLEALGVDVAGPAAANSKELASLITTGPVLVVGAAQMRDELTNALAERGVDVTRVTCYETVVITPSEEQIAQLRGADVVVVAAPSAWQVARSFVLPQTWVVVRGATTGDAVRAEHRRVLESWGPSLRETLATLRS